MKKTDLSLALAFLSLAFACGLDILLPTLGFVLGVFLGPLLSSFLKD